MSQFVRRNIWFPSQSWKILDNDCWRQLDTPWFALPADQLLAGVIPRLSRIAQPPRFGENIDTPSWVTVYPMRETIKLAERSIYVLHDIGNSDLDPAMPGPSDGPEREGLISCSTSGRSAA